MMGKSIIRRDLCKTLPFLIYPLLIPLILWSCATSYKEYQVSLNQHALVAEKFFSRGDYAQAFTNYEKALSSYENHKNEQGVLFCLERMGWIERERGEYGSALDLFRKAYPIGVRLNGDAAEIDADLGDVYLFSGATQKAKDHYQKALSTLKNFVFKTSYSSPPSGEEIITMIRKSKAIINARVNLGTLYYFSGEYDRALENLKKAEELINRILKVVEHPLYGMFIKLDSVIYDGIGFCQTFMGATYGEEGKFNQAWKHFDAGRDAFQEGNKQFGLLVNQALRYKIEFLSSAVKIDREKFEEYDAFLEKADRLGGSEVVWRMCYEIGRALNKHNKPAEARKYLARSIDVLELTRSKLREDTIKKMFASSVQDVYVEMIILLFEMKQFEEGFDYLERAKARAFLDMLAGRSVKAKKSVDPLLVKKDIEIQNKIDMVAARLKTARGSDRESDYEAYRKLLKERKNLLEAIKGQSLEFAATTAVTTVPVSKIAARLSKDTALVSYFLHKKRILMWVVNKGSVSAVSVGTDRINLDELITDYREAISSQQEMLIADLGSQLSMLLIKPFINHLAGSKRLFIVPSKSLHHLPFSSLPLSEKRFLVQDFAITILPNASSLFFMDKAVSTDRNSILAMGNPERGKEEMNLEFAEAEVKFVSKDFPFKTVLTGKKASESVMKERDLTDAGVIHIAAHGRYFANQPLKSALFLAEDHKNDGNLETIEIFSLSLNPRLIVLSACQSGIGKVEGGDEIQSLNRAFIYAGAGGVVASLWSVSDRSTFELMKYFYSGLKLKSPAEALQEAQVKLMKQYPPPFYWAPFYLTYGLGK